MSQAVGRGLRHADFLLGLLFDVELETTYSSETTVKFALEYTSLCHRREKL
jgi:hypothetical protein